MAKITQEFYCNKCDGYFIFTLHQTDINRRILVVCPNCQRKHQRQLQEGLICDAYKTGDENQMEEIHLPKSAYSKEPKTVIQQKAKQAQYELPRGGISIKEPHDLLDESWFDRYGDRI